jgi:hypothetical protein
VFHWLSICTRDPCLLYRIQLAFLSRHSEMACQGKGCGHLIDLWMTDENVLRNYIFTANHETQSNFSIHVTTHCSTEREDGAVHMLNQAMKKYMHNSDIRKDDKWMGVKCRCTRERREIPTERREITDE